METGNPIDYLKHEEKQKEFPRLLDEIENKIISTSEQLFRLEYTKNRLIDMEDTKSEGTNDNEQVTPENIEKRMVYLLHKLDTNLIHLERINDEFDRVV